MACLREAFMQACDDVREAGKFYLSLYVRVPYYGGPEEGGWWGEDIRLVAYNEYLSLEQAQEVEKAIQEMVDDENRCAKKQFSQMCSDQMDWLDARGLESDFLPEVSGEEQYFLSVEQELGASVSVGCRHYE